MAVAMTQDLYNSLSAIDTLRAQAFTATANGTGIDLKGYESALVVADIGTFGGTSPTATLRVEESDDDSTYTAVADADLVGGANSLAITTANDVALWTRGYIGDKRYIRAAISAIGGTSPSLPLSAVVLRGHARHLPVTQGS